MTPGGNGGNGSIGGMAPGGYGIGLSIAKAIAEQHKGDIAAYKKDNSHIGFKVTLKI